eukprot:1119837-Pyramimonas_sp.AAC.1
MVTISINSPNLAILEPTSSTIFDGPSFNSSNFCEHVGSERKIGHALHNRAPHGKDVEDDGSIFATGSSTINACTAAGESPNVHLHSS